MIPGSIFTTMFLEKLRSRWIVLGMGNATVTTQPHINFSGFGYALRAEEESAIAAGLLEISKPHHCMCALSSHWEANNGRSKGQRSKARFRYTQVVE